MAPPAESPWKTCRVCGDAVPPAAAACPTCGAPGALGPADLGRLPRRTRWRVVSTRGVRALVVAAVVIGIAYFLLSAVWSGPPAFPDPLTTQASYTVAAGRYTAIVGDITGEDYIVGNYTVQYPPGALIGFTVYNSTEFAAFRAGENASAAWTIVPQSSGRIVFAAPYTDTFALVFTNPYPAASGISVTFYATTTYESNVVIG